MTEVRRRRPVSSWVLLGLVLSPSLLKAAELNLAPESIRVEPREIRLEGARDRQQLAVSWLLADGSVRDLTAFSRFRVEPESLARVTSGGVLTPTGNGPGRIVVEVQDRRVEVPISVALAEKTRPIGYRLDVGPIFSKAGCNMGACHGNLNGKGGFRLSLRGEDPGFDLIQITREAQARRIDRHAPDQSLLLLKPSGQVFHEGGQRLAIGSPEAEVLRDWIAQGASDDFETAPRVIRLSVYPSERVSPAPSRSQQLIVTAEFSDGSRRDVTRQSAFDPSDPTRVSVSADGLVKATGPLEAAIAVRYLNGRGVSRLAFLADRPNFVWKDLEEKNAIDRAIFAKLRSLKIHPSEPSTDAVFLRRVFLDALGILPTADEARAFLLDTDPEKRGKLIDRLVDRPEFADFWALKWADLLRNEEKTMGEKGVWALNRWLRDQVASDLPMDEFARKLVSSQGSTWANPPASFYRTNRDPSMAAEAIAQVFLGVRLQCARCHNHPFDVWTQDDYYGLAAFFGNINRKQISNVRKDDLDKHEINGDEIVYLKGKPTMIQPRSGKSLAPKPLGAPASDLGGDRDALDDLAAWLTRDNPRFSRNLANRVWFHLMGRGVVEPVDDFRESNPPSNPALLDALTSEFLEGGMRLRPLVRFILKSTVYGLGSTPEETNIDDESNFSHASVRLVAAEPLLDAISQALGSLDRFPNAPRGTRAGQLPGVKGDGSFLKVFGKPDRLLTCECERSESTTLAQAFQLINGESVRRKLESKSNRITGLLDSGIDDRAILDEIYLASLSRFPNEAERRSIVGHIEKSADRRKAWEDAAWAVLNSKEFLLRH